MRAVSVAALLLTGGLVLAACAGPADSAPAPADSAPAASSTPAQPSPTPTLVYASVPPVASAKTLGNLLPTQTDAAAALDPFTSKPGKSTTRSGPLDWSDANQVAPAQCATLAAVGLGPIASADGPIQLQASSNWASREQDDSDLPKRTVTAQLLLFADDSQASAAFDELATTAEACATYQVTMDVDSVAAEELGWADLDPDLLTAFDVRHPLIRVDHPLGVLQLVSGQSAPDAGSATTVVRIADRLLVTGTWGMDPLDDAAYDAFNAFTLAGVAQASGSPVPAPLALAPLADLPEMALPAVEEDGEDGTSANRPGVTYRVTGSSARVSLTYATATGTEQTTASTPWEYSLGEVPSGTFLYVSTQDDTGGGSVTCSITVSGTEISRNTSSGAYSIATCDGSR